jgi:glycosyltransferase involved in cell wall biosynthesis
MEQGIGRLTILYHHRTRARDGQSVHIDELIHALRGLGHKVIVVEPRRVDATAQTLERRLLPKFVYELAEVAYSLVEFAKLAAAVIRHRPDALYERANLFMLSGLWSARIFKLPYLLEVNAPLAQERARYNGLSWPTLAAWTECACWRGASIVLPVTQALADIIMRSGVPPERITVTPNGVNPDVFFPQDSAAAKTRLGLKASLILGFVGYVREWHRLDRAIELLARRPAMTQAHLLIVGDGPARPALEQLAQALHVADRVHFTGIVSRDLIPGHVAAFDIALQPEVTAYASPLKLFEYMAQARTIVAPATSNISEILEDQVDAILFRPDQDDALGSAIEQLASDAKLRERLGLAAARKIADRNLTWEGNARRVASIIESLRPGPHFHHRPG